MRAPNVMRQQSQYLREVDDVMLALLLVHSFLLHPGPTRTLVSVPVLQHLPSAEQQPTWGVGAGVPGGSVGCPCAYQDQFVGSIESHRGVHARKDFFSGIFDK